MFKRLYVVAAHYIRDKNSHCAKVPQFASTIKATIFHLPHDKRAGTLLLSENRHARLNYTHHYFLFPSVKITIELEECDS